MGLVQRRGRSKAGTACGALIAYHSEVTAGHLVVKQDPMDLEMSLLRQVRGNKTQNSFSMG